MTGSEMNAGMRFHAEKSYRDRKSKARYVASKYRSILVGSILDVGADQCYLRDLLGPEANYWGIGIGGNPDQVVDLEAGPLPFDNGSFDCVLCLDVLEHLDDIHSVFDELCRVSRRYVIIALPNPWSAFVNMLRRGHFTSDQPMKQYNLPVDPPVDRHKWFFSATEAEKFIVSRGRLNEMRVVQLDRAPSGGRRTHILKWVVSQFVHRDIAIDDLFSGSVWAVLEKGASS